MDKTETAKLLGNLSILYGRPKGDPEMTADVWHELVKQYEYKDALKAMYDFARQDTRDYATFPAPGVIISFIEKGIEHKKGLLYRTFNDMFDGRPYEELPEGCKEICPQSVYERGLAMDTDELLMKKAEFINYISKKQLMLEG